ncbi:MAG TPA: T9SS type A sorting domain-containing protein, partial [Chitinophagaceae bacterium]|nr:T9SS type A sorting domain-containing protein [Chitinophagaceae bacterium]
NVTNAVWGNSPALPANATVNDNIPMQYDFRSVYASLLENWLCVKNSDLQTIMLKNFQNIPLVNSATCKNVIPNTSGTNLITNSPNPFTGSTTIKFTTAGGHTLIQIMDTLGRVLSTPVDSDYGVAGTYTIQFNGVALPYGIYYARLQNGAVQQVRTMMKAR